MKNKLMLFRFGLSLLLFGVFGTACGGRCNPDHRKIKEIQSPQVLPNELGDIQFYLFKRGDFGSKVFIQTLDRKKSQLYHNSLYISRVDVSPDGRDLVYVQMTTIGDIHPVWMRRVDLESGLERKIAGWYKDIYEVSISNPGFTYDGEQVLFTVTWYDTGKIGLARVNIDGSGLEILDTDIPLTEGPESSPDGSMILLHVLDLII